LKPKQQRFVDEYLIDLNATQAAIRAGYSSKTANEQGARLLATVSVKTAIEKAIKDRSERTKRTADDVLIDIQDATRRARQADDLRHEFKGLELEGRHYGMFTDKHEHDVGVSLKEVLERDIRAADRVKTYRDAAE
jgi:phage terminase small subunit